MSVYELEVISKFFARAVCPEDIFGNLVGTSKDTLLKSEHRKLAKVLHPDRHVGDASASALAKDLFQQLEDMHREAVSRIAEGSYGKRTPAPNKVTIVLKSKYALETPFFAGDIADIHSASVESGKRKTDLIVKVARKAADNDLLLSEHTILEKIHSNKKFEETLISAGIPRTVESFLIDDGRQRRRVNVQKRLEGFYDGVYVHKKFPIGVDGRTIAWMWKRTIVLLEWVWRMGYIHGAVLPPHIMFFPDNSNDQTKDPRKHTIRLVDWCYAIPHKSRTRLSAWIPEYEDFYAPEILNKKPLGLWTDLYMGAKTMLYLMGGDVKKNGFPDGIPNEIIISLTKCLTGKRPQSHSEYFDEFDAAVKKAYGARKWHNFNMPGI